MKIEIEILDNGWKITHDLEKDRPVKIAETDSMNALCLVAQWMGILARIESAEKHPLA